MKKTAIIIFSIFLCSCSISKEYDSLQDCYNDVKDMSYTDIVKVWGEPDVKEDMAVTSPSLQQEQEGIKANYTITCIWKRGKVNIHNSECISLNFDVVEIPGQLFYPSRVKSYNENCTSISNNSTTNNYENDNNSINNSEPNKPDNNIYVDSGSTNTIEKIKPKADSIGLINISKFNTVYQISNKLPLSYYTGNLKFTFRKDTVLKVDCYDGEELYKTFICKQERDDIIPMGCDKYFTYREGELFLVTTSNHNSTQLAMVK
ncbi:MAG: hypothetical protein JWQ79_1864 [Mucilaginibacter sp.]|nr:hypothetical protein [Mucilaginibacter sp.]